MEQTALGTNTPATKMPSDNDNSNPDTSNSNPHHDSSGAGLDFLGDGSMKDIAMKMGDIDKVLDEIHLLDDEKPNRSGVKDAAATNLDKSSSAQGSPTAVIHSNAVTDDDFDEADDDDDEDIAGMSIAALAQMQAELKQVEEAEREMQEQQKQKQQMQAPPPPPLSAPPQQTMLGATVTAIATKPTPDSRIGISMKTSKGLTWIVGISESGLLKDSDLRGGKTMLLKSINGVPIKNARHARTLILGSQRKVKIVAQEVLKQ